jgi:hypothetical protein
MSKLSRVIEAIVGHWRGSWQKGKLCGVGTQHDAFRIFSIPIDHIVAECTIDTLAHITLISQDFRGGRCKD